MLRYDPAVLGLELLTKSDVVPEDLFVAQDCPIPEKYWRYEGLNYAGVEKDVGVVAQEPFFFLPEHPAELVRQLIERGYNYGCQDGIEKFRESFRRLFHLDAFSLWQELGMDETIAEESEGLT